MFPFNFSRTLVIIRKNHTWFKPEGYDTGINIYNCVAKDKVKLILQNKNVATWYTCGPTVYDSSHIGHASCYVKLDIIQRLLRNYFKINLVTAMNITDIDDKIIKRSNERKVSAQDLSEHYEKEFWEDLNSLNVSKPNIVLKVTDNINLIVNYIKKLIENKSAYVAKDGSVYFDLSYFKYYEKLQPIGISSTEEDGIKKSLADFALWKVSKPNEPFWESEWSRGRPGWHIECSVLASLIFGSTVDIHAGGIDLRFPHHENEEAQCCAYFQKPQWVNYWIHTGHLHLSDKVKMSKSLNNTISINNMLKTCNVDVFRIACLMSHYRSNMEFSDDFIKTSESVLKNYKNFINNCNTYLKGKQNCQIDNEFLIKHFNDTVIKIDEALRNDFDTATVLKELNYVIKIVNKMFTSVSNNLNICENSYTSIIAVSNFITNIFEIFGINLQSKVVQFSEGENLNKIVDILINFRQNIRAIGISNRETELLLLCDNVREDLKKVGIVVNDHGKISSWSQN